MKKLITFFLLVVSYLLINSCHSFAATRAASKWGVTAPIRSSVSLASSYLARTNSIRKTLNETSTMGGTLKTGFTDEAGDRTAALLLSNAAPALNGIESTALSYTEGDAATAITNTISVSDVDNTTQASGTVSITSGFSSSQDVLSFTNDGSSMGNIAASYNAATGVLTMTSFGATATLAQWQSAFRAVKYRNTSQNPSTSTRTVSFTINDGSANSNAVTRNITITAVNNNPSASGIPASISQTEDFQSVAGFSSIVVSDPDAGSGKVTIKFSAESGTMVYALGIGITETGIASKNVTFTGTITDLNFFLSIATNILYTPAQNVNGTGADHITVTLNDNGNTGSGGGTDIVVGIIPVNIAAVNDPPVLTGINGTNQAVFENTGPQLLSSFSSATVSDVDNLNFNSGNISIAQTSGTTNGNWGVDGTNVTSGGDGTIAAGETVFVGGTAIGTVNATNDGQGGNILEIDFNSNSTLSRIQTFLRDLTYSAPSGLGARNFTLTANDGGGTANGGVATTSANFTITVDSAPPVISNLDGDNASVNVGGPANNIDVGDNCTVSDADSPNFNTGNLTITQNSGTANGSFSLTGSGSTGVASGTSTLDADGTISGSEIVFVNGSAIASVSSSSDGQGGNNLVLNFGSNATPARTQTLIRALLYSAPSGAGDRTFTLSIKDASTNSATGSANFTITVLSPSMNLQQGSTTIANNGSYNFGYKILNSNTDVKFKIINSGTGSLNITTPITIGGADAGQFSVQQQPSSTVNPSDSTSFIIRFTPTSSGYKTANISITNNDAGKNPYNFTLSGNGNTPPVLAGIETSGLNYTEGDAATAITSSITVSDADNANLDSAEVGITSNYMNGEDVLSYTQVGSITGVFNAATGRMTLSGSDTKANYQAALKSVRYKNTSNNPSTAARTVDFYVNDGHINSDTLTRNITVTAVNNPPVLAGIETSALDYTEGNGAKQITNTVTVSDPDNTNMSGAVVQITSNYVYREDVLSYTQVGSITGSFDAATGKMTLTGSDTKANYQAALRAVKYDNTSQDPTGSARSVSFIVNDGSANSAAATRQININSVNNPPSLAAVGINPKFTEGGSAVNIFSSASVSTNESEQKIITLTLTVTNLHDGSNEILNIDGSSVTLTNGNSVITAGNSVKAAVSLSGSTATVTVSKSAGISTTAVQSIINGLSYKNTSFHPDISSRVITLTSIQDNGGTANGGVDTKALSVVSTVSFGTVSYTISGNAGVPGATISWKDGTNKTATADAKGNYNISVSYYWSGDVVPSKEGYTFNPSSRGYTNVLSNQSSQNYSAKVITYTISGNTEIPNVLLLESDGETTTSDNSGNYSFTVPYNWSGIITPDKDGYKFDPASITFSGLTQDMSKENYKAVPLTYIISGNTGVPGAIINWTDTTKKSISADNSGNYSITVSYNWSGAVTPSLSGYTFSPDSIRFSDNQSDQIQKNFAPAIPSPENLSTKYNGSGVMLSWKYQAGSAEFSGFIVYRSGGPGNTSPKINSILSLQTFSPIDTLGASKTQYLDTGIKNGYTYEYEIVAFDSVNNISSSVLSSEGDSSKIIVPLKVPGNLSFKLVDNKSVKLTWNNTTDLKDGFIIDRSIGDTTSFAQIAKVAGSDTVFSDENISGGKTYYYKVASYKDTLISPFTDYVKVTITITGISMQKSGIPQTYALYQNYPNPFNPSTSIRFDIPRESNVVIDIYNALGQRVKEMNEGIMMPGYYTEHFDGSRLSSGIYIYTIEAGKFRAVKKMLMLK